MRAYYEADGVTLYHGDALAVLRALPDASVDLIATDPPYFRVKGAAWDRAWADADAFLAWMGELCAEWRRVLKPNGSLYVFASPEMSRRVDRVVEQHFNVLNVVRWEKAEGWHQKAEKEALRSYLSPWEAVIFAEHITGDSYAEDASGYYTATTELRRRVYAPLGDYFRDVREAAGLTRNDAEVALGFVSSADPTRGTALYTRWEEGAALPSRPTYERLVALVGAGNAPRSYESLRQWFDEDLRQEYEDLRQEYEDLRQEYEDLRRPFALSPTVPWSDTWRFGTVPPYPGKHECEKPIAMMEHIVAASSRPGAVVLDCFSGSGTTLEAARNLGRLAIGVEADAHWCGYTRERLAQGSLFMDPAA